MFAWWGQFVYRFRWAVLGVSAIMLAGSIVAFLNGGTLKNSGGENTESGRAVALMQKRSWKAWASGFRERQVQRSSHTVAFSLFATPRITSTWLTR